MNKSHFLPLLTCFTGALVCATPAVAEKCEGGICTTCKDCSRCGHCAKKGGYCSACRPDLFANIATLRPAPAPARRPGNASGASRRIVAAPQQRTQMEQSWVRQQRLNREAAASGHIDESGQWVPARAVAVAKPALAPFSGQCVGVTDGDTIKVLHGGTAETIRLNAIDAPEKKQSFGEVSKQSLSKLAFGQSVTIYPSSRDRYGRTLAWVFVGKNNLNAAQVQSGLAWWYREYAPKEAKMGALEGQARAAKIGLWRDAAPMAPWLYRKAKK